jgi:hypothetical protein
MKALRWIRLPSNNKPPESRTNNNNSKDIVIVVVVVVVVIAIAITKLSNEIVFSNGVVCRTF